MVNGQRIAHGGLSPCWTDSTFAFCLQNSRNERPWRRMRYHLHQARKLGDRLVATAREISRSGRSGIYDISVAAEGVVIAEFRAIPAPSPARAAGGDSGGK